MKLVLLISVLLLTLFSQESKAQKDPLTRILFIYDASNSMNGLWESGVKHKIASKLLMQSLDSMHGVKNLQVAMRVYGHQKYYKNGQDCEDTKLEVPFGYNNFDAMKKTLYGITPKGTTLIAYSLEQSKDDFPPCDNCRNIIILITDGIEECNGDPCAISLALQSNGITLKPFIIGVGLDANFTKTFECIGNFYDAANEATFQQVLKIVISQAMNSTTTQVNLLDSNEEPNETNVNMTFYDHFTKQIHHNFIHTINHRGNPDTIPLDPIPTYDMVVHTIPELRKDSIVLTPGIHNIIAVDAPQGQLELKVAHNASNQFKDLRAMVHLQGSCEIINMQAFKGNEKYLVGKYDLEILTLPRTYINDVEITQSHTTKVEIPKPGTCTISSNTLGYGSVYLVKNDGQLERIYNYTNKMMRETLLLQPGNYKAVFRPESSKRSMFTIERNFTIKSGSSSSIRLF